MTSVPSRSTILLPEEHGLLLPEEHGLNNVENRKPRHIAPPSRLAKQCTIQESVRPALANHSHGGNTAMGCYDLQQVLGRGNFATVKQAVHVFSGEVVAVKVIDKTKLDANGQTHLLQEVRCMKLLQHPNIVRLFEVIDTPSTLFLVLELADGGDMYDYMMKNEKAMSEKTARHYFTQIVQAVGYCHRLYVVHRDLKPENVLMFRKLRMVKLTDFGFGYFYQPGTCLETSCGSMRYSSPEILFGKKYDGPAVDVWGMGILLYAMVCGRPPFMEDNDSETISAIMDCRYPLPATLSSSCISLIGRMLVKKAEERATIPEITQHAWLQESSPLHAFSSLSGDSPSSQPAAGAAMVSPSSLTCPLVSRRGLTDDAHEWVIKMMLDGGVASNPDDVNQALHAGEYNNITATYYLLAERLLRSQAATVPPLNLEDEEFIPVSTHFANFGDTTDSSKPNRGCLMSSRNNRRNAAGGNNGGQTKRPALDLSSVVEILEEMEEESEEPESDVHCTSTGSETGKKTSASSRYSPSTSRRLTSAKSSPHLQLNKIKEEVCADDEEDDFLDEAFFLASDVSLRNRERHITSPDRLQRIERSRRQRSRSGSGSSQTSSDTSDTDEVAAIASSASNVPAPRMPFSRHRHFHRHRSQSSCSRLCHSSSAGAYSRESSETELPTRASAPILFFAGDVEDASADDNVDAVAVKRRIPPPVLQHSQSLVIIPCCVKGARLSGDSGDGKLSTATTSGSKRKHLIHRPHSLPPVPHFSSQFAAGAVGGEHSNSTSPTASRFFIRQQC
ncbi:SNF-related serine/threonine-protein kinase [Hypsibius exemplaris]|uniref:SNF-related serine/threonine-protein kinase n=1 Tax=Hypsibius exemplaris TaxID=2072580 RepID=A0A1W0X2E8_HYPEX|nr:SNF-related serine/threonine-protein kinase [Hypsibius exemplaris]